MAHLLLLYQKLRLQREENHAQYELLKMTGLKDRIHRQIDRKQKFYNKKMTNLDSMVQRMKSSAKLYFNSVFGMSSNMVNTNPYAYAGGAQNNMGIMQVLAQAFQAGQTNSKVFNTMDEYMAFTNSNYKQGLNADGKTVFVQQNEEADENGRYNVDYDSPEQVEIREKMQEASRLQNQAYQQYTMNQNNCNIACTNYENNISIWLEDQKAQIEAEQDAVLLPLQDAETEYDLEKQSLEVKLENIKERKQSIDKALGEAIRDSAPKFGLG